MNDIIEDLLKIYISCFDSYNSKIHQTINDKYTIIDKSVLAIYHYIKILEDRSEKNQEAINVLSNYILKHTIYSETGNIVFEITDKSKINLYNEILDKLILEKFEYKNRVMRKLKYNYKTVNFQRSCGTCYTTPQCTNPGGQSVSFLYNWGNVYGAICVKEAE